jgi:hypothetical protein
MSQRTVGEQCQQASVHSAEGRQVPSLLAVHLSPEGMQGGEEFQIKSQDSEILGEACDVRQSVEDFKLQDAFLQTPSLMLAPVQVPRSDQCLKLGSVNRMRRSSSSPNLSSEQRYGRSYSTSALRRPSLVSGIVEPLDSGCRQGVLLHICALSVHLIPWCCCQAVMMIPVAGIFMVCTTAQLAWSMALAQVLPEVRMESQTA